MITCHKTMSYHGQVTFAIPTFHSLDNEILFDEFSHALISIYCSTESCKLEVDRILSRMAHFCKHVSRIVFSAN
jgi:hypothetical protein